MNIQSGQFEDFADMLVEDMFDSNGVSCNGGIYFMGTKGMHIWRNEWSFVAYK